MYFKAEYFASVAKVFQLHGVFFSFDNRVPKPLDPRCHLHMLCMYVAALRWPKDILGLGEGGTHLK